MDVREWDTYKRWYERQSKEKQSNADAIIFKYTKGLSLEKMLGDGVSELKHQSGVRVYFGERKNAIYLILGGTKNSRQQSRDIAKAKKLWEVGKHGI